MASEIWVHDPPRRWSHPGGRTGVWALEDEMLGRKENGGEMLIHSHWDPPPEWEFAQEPHDVSATAAMGIGWRREEVFSKLMDLACRLRGELEVTGPVVVEGDSITFDVDRMEEGRFYLAQMGDEPYLFRRVAEDTVDVFGLA